MPPLKVWSPPAREWGPWYKLIDSFQGLIRLVIDVKPCSGFSDGFDLELSYWTGRELVVEFCSGSGPHEIFLVESPFCAKIRLRNHTAGGLLTICANAHPLPCFTQQTPLLESTV